MELKEIKMEQFLKSKDGLLKLIYQTLAAAAEKNAMNCVPTEQEVQQMQDNALEIRKNLNDMLVEVSTKIVQYEGNLQQKTVACTRLTQELTDTYENMDGIRKAQADLSAVIAQNRCREYQYLREYDDACRKQKEMEERKEQKIREKEEKRKKAIKYCWVPGYNIYLGIDLALDDCEGQLRLLNSKCTQIQNEINELRNKAEASKRDLDENNRRYEQLERQEIEIREKIRETEAGMAALKREIVKWEDLKLRLADLHSRIEAGNMAPDCLMETLDLLEMLRSGGI